MRLADKEDEHSWGIDNEGISKIILAECYLIEMGVDTL